MYQELHSSFILNLELITAVVMTIGYLSLRNIFNKWDQEEKLKISMKEGCLFGLLFYIISILMLGKVDFGNFLMITFNVVCLAFLAYIDAKTKLLYTLVLYLLIAINSLVFMVCFIFGKINIEPDLGWAVVISYLTCVVLLCITRAIAVGDGIIYAALLPVLLMIEKDSGFRAICLTMINLMIPLFSFTLVEGTKFLRQWCKTRKKLSQECLRKPFAPYLLLGFIISVILKIY